ncbi:MAG: sigma-70 family RNA polymerase sigma factor [Anaerolineae bacterium]|nr:sigma-70 family RNA polymerase sigma factor [Anaerolineae bacterium]
MVERSNAQWIDVLSAAGNTIERGQAIEDLRTRLQRGIYYYLSRERSDLNDLSPDELTQMAQDFAQDATLRVLDNLDTFRGDSQFTTWAMKIAMRVAISEMRRARYKDYSLDELTENGEVPAVANAAPISSAPIARPEQVIEQEDVLGKVTEAFQNVLTPRQRTAMEAIILDDIPLEVVAEQMGTNRNALYKLIHDARRKLRDYLEETGLSPEYILDLFER